MVTIKPHIVLLQKAHFQELKTYYFRYIHVSFIVKPDEELLGKLETVVFSAVVAKNKKRH